MDQRFGDQASFYRAALLLGLLPGSHVVGWADTVVDDSSPVPPAFIEIAAISPTDLTALRQALLALCEERESDSVVRALLGLVGRDLASRRRNITDTMTVLGQMRAFLFLSRRLGEEIKILELRFLRARGLGDTSDFERQVNDWLREYEGAGAPWL